MNTQLDAAFQAGARATPQAFSVVFAGLFCAAILLCSSWILLSAYRGISTGQVSWRQLGSITARTVLLILVSFWLVLS